MLTTPAPGGTRVPYSHLVQVRMPRTAAGPALPKCACQRAPSSRAQIICPLQQSASCWPRAERPAPAQEWNVAIRERMYDSPPEAEALAARTKHHEYMKCAVLCWGLKEYDAALSLIITALEHGTRATEQ